MDSIQPAKIAHLPPNFNFETAPIYKALAYANRALAGLQGTARSLPNQGVLISTLAFQEAMASSAIENIVTTQDEAFKAALFETGTVEAKEVARYSAAMRQGYEAWRDRGFISESMLIDMFRVLKQRGDGYRTAPGTVLRNTRTGEIVHKPPQERREVEDLMRQLEGFINNEPPCEIDPLIKMALIHHQFESIHPFPDGNGRVGRILNVLYLTHTHLLDFPILYLSRAINRTKPDYYRLLQAVRTEGAWEEWVIYMLNAVAETAASTLQLVKNIHTLIMDTKQKLRAKPLEIYSQELLNNLFRHPYTRIEFLQRDTGVHYNTAASRLKKLTSAGVLEVVNMGRHGNYYINRPLVNLLSDAS